MQLWASVYLALLGTCRLARARWFVLSLTYLYYKDTNKRFQAQSNISSGLAIAKEVVLSAGSHTADISP
eukprot:scaffold390726_cov18-Prasinocladus_malaysianus.AAC.1